MFGGVGRNRRLGEWRGPHTGLEQSLSSMPGKAKHTHLHAVSMYLFCRSQAGCFRSLGGVGVGEWGQEKYRGKCDLSSSPGATRGLLCGLG